MLRVTFEARAGIEPAHRGFADRCVTTSPPGRLPMILAFGLFGKWRTGFLAVVEEEVDARERP